MCLNRPACACNVHECKLLATWNLCNIWKLCHYIISASPRVMLGHFVRFKKKVNALNSTIFVQMRAVCLDLPFCVSLSNDSRLSQCCTHIFQTFHLQGKNPRWFVAIAWLCGCSLLSPGTTDHGVLRFVWDTFSLKTKANGKFSTLIINRFRENPFTHYFEVIKSVLVPSSSDHHFEHRLK